MKLLKESEKERERERERVLAKRHRETGEIIIWPKKTFRARTFMHRNRSNLSLSFKKSIVCSASSLAIKKGESKWWSNRSLCSKQFMICNFAEVTLPMNHRCAFDCKWWSWKTIIFRLRFVVLARAKGRKSRNLKWSIGVISRCDILANDLFHFGKAQWGPVETEHFGEDFLSLYWCFWRKTIWEVSSIFRFKF